MARRDRKKSTKTSVSNCSFSDDKIEAMKQKARELSKMVVKHSKTLITEQQTSLSETSSNNEQIASRIDIIPVKNETKLLQNNSHSTTLENYAIADDLSCTKNSIEQLLNETISTANYSSKRKKNNNFKIKHKKPKIPYLVKCDIYKEEHVDELTSKKQDEYVLEKLFNKSGMFYLNITAII